MFVRVLTAASVDSSPSLLLCSSNGSKILVNCGEGCQRAFIEYSQRLSTVKAVCLTHLGHEAVGGLPGVILTSADGAAAANASAVLQGTTASTEPSGNLDIVGPVGTQQFLKSLRHFMRREKFKTHVSEGLMSSFYPTRPTKKRGSKRKKDSSLCDTAEFSIQTIACCQTVDTCNPLHTRSKQFSRCVPVEGTLVQKRQILSYVFRTPTTPGKFLPDKAIALGVPKGPLFAKLKYGESVSFVDDGGNEVTVESSEVVTQPSPPVAVLVLCYPTKEIANQLFVDKYCFPETELIVHMTSKTLFEQTGLFFWQERKPSVQHILLSTNANTADVIGSPFMSSILGAKCRSLLSETIFSVPRQPKPVVQVESPHYKVGTSMMEYTLVPRSKRGFLDSNTFFQKRREAEEMALNNVAEGGALALSQTLLLDAKVPADPGNCAELIFTGTGSAIPCKHRNVTGMLLRQSDGRSILLDVGEGTIGQLLRIQQDQKEDVLSNINAVWISHPHADHHLGLVRLLTERRAAEPILLLAPAPIFMFLDEYCQACCPELRKTYTAIDSSQLVSETHPYGKQLHMHLGITSYRAVPVSHCAHSYAIILNGTSFGRIVYSGDCRPSQKLATVAQGADLLIHEATFEEGMEAEAILKRHSTVGEALSIASKMHAKCTVLTHFSQRYPKISPMPLGPKPCPIVFAFDFMKLRPQTLLAASTLTPAVRLLYPPDSEESSPPSLSDKVLSTPGIFSNSSLL